MSRARLALLLVAGLAGCATTRPESHGGAASLTAPTVVQTLADGSRQALDRATLTPLFFGTERDGGRAVITSGEHFYAVSLHRDGHSLALHGVDQVHAQVDDEVAEGAPPTSNATVRGRPATVLVNEAIRSVAWEEDGAYWSLEVECDLPESDTRCTEDAYLLSEADALIDLRAAR